MRDFEKSICALTREGHANLLDYPFSMYYAAFEELKDANKASK